MDLTLSAEAERILRQICDEALENRRADRFDPGASANQLRERDRPVAAASPRWRELQNDPVELQMAVAMTAHAWPHVRPWPNWMAQQLEDTARQIVVLSLGRDLPFTASQLVHIFQSWRELSVFYNRSDYTAMLGAVGRLTPSKAVAEELRPVIGDIQQLLFGRLKAPVPRKATLELVERFDRLLAPLATAEGPYRSFLDAIRDWKKALPTPGVDPWGDFKRHCAAGGSRSRPSDKWLETTRLMIAKIDRPKFSESLSQWMAEVARGSWPSELDDGSLRGLIWAAGLSADRALVGEIGRFAEKCFQKIPYIGLRNAGLGNAALWSLSAMAGEPLAAAELFRLREKIRYPSPRKLISACLVELAEKSGVTVEALEDLSLPSFGLDGESCLIVRFGDTRVELCITPTETVQQWFNAAGKRVKSAPTEARVGDMFAAYRRQAKDLEAARQGQVLRLEQAWIEERSWAFSDWEEHFFSHPLRRPIVGALIWQIGDMTVMPEQAWIEERSWAFSDWEEHFFSHPLRRPIVGALIWQIGDMTVMPEAGAFRDVAGRAHSFGPDARVQLWHPLDADPGQVLAWRTRILEQELTQPIKQAHREIYVLTDAERATETYSNRFAAHILRQHQLQALCRARGWKYSVSQGWDGWNDWNVPTRQLPKLQMTVEYNVEMVDQHLGPEALYVSSDQVRFKDLHGRSIALDEIAPIVFSEVLRDVDLFVAVSSVANDPAWTDGGPNGGHGAYWREWAFGELGQSAATRKALISWLMPKLSIADKLEITDKFLVVQGRRQKYAIHFGSSNIQILPSNRYLCIVPDRVPEEAAKVRLPFAGDGLLSVILSKAFLLVDESRITDETILRQL